MKKILLIALTMFMVGCEKETVEISSNYNFPDELSDCKLFYLSNSGGGWIKVMRCPNSTTSTNYQSGKTNATTILTEDNIKIEEMENQIKDLQNKINQMKKEN